MKKLLLLLLAIFLLTACTVSEFERIRDESTKTCEEAGGNPIFSNGGYYSGCEFLPSGNL